MNKFMQRAVEEATEGVRKKEGGPFGAVIVKNGKIVAVGNNRVIATNDPTAHAEIVAIRRASKKLGRFDLSDCEIYSSCEPCPMCCAAIHWAKIPVMYYGATRKDAAAIGFDDKYLYDILSRKIEDDKLSVTQIDRDECLEPFRDFARDGSRTLY